MMRLSLPALEDGGDRAGLAGGEVSVVVVGAVGRGDGLWLAAGRCGREVGRVAWMVNVAFAALPGMDVTA
jgi:hypothetical protein